MANYNQAPLNQSSLALEAFALGLGTAGNAAFLIATNLTSVFSTGPVESVLIDNSPIVRQGVYPAYRRAARVITSNR
jgi:hypothetical protein